MRGLKVALECFARLGWFCAGSNRRRGVRFFALVLAGGAIGLGPLAPAAGGAGREWDGDEPMDNTWSAERNWAGNTVPSAGDDLLFISGARHPQNQNNLDSGLTFNSLELRGGGGGGGGGGGFDIGGNLIALNAGIRVENNSGMVINHAISIPFLLNSNQTFTVINEGGLFSLNGGVNLNGKAWVWDVAALSDTVVQGVISGSGSLVKTGAGPLVLAANNTYTGVTRVDGGTLRVDGSQAGSPVDLIAGNLTGNGTVGDVTAVGTGGIVTIVVRPGNNPGVMTCSNLALNDSTFFVAQLHGPTPGSGYSQMRARGSVALGGAGLSLIFNFTPAVGASFVLIENDGVDPVVGRFFDYPEGAFLTQGLSLLRLSYQGGDGNDVVITRVNPPAQLTRVTEIDGGAMEVEGQGLPDLVYAMQGVTNLGPGTVWVPLGAVTANGAGIFTFKDPEAGSLLRRFYRAVSP